jgi:hypothetical protein
MASTPSNGGLAPDPQIWLASFKFCEPCGKKVEPTLEEEDEDDEDLPALISEVEPTFCSFCELVGHDIHHCGAFELYQTPHIKPPLPKACTWCHLFGHSKPNCARVHQRFPDTAKAAAQLRKHESIKASIKPYKTQAEVKAIKQIQRNQEVDKKWKRRLAARKVKEMKDLRELNSIPVLNPVKTQPAGPSTASCVFSGLLKMWPIYLALMVTFLEEVVSFIQEFSVVSLIQSAFGWFQSFNVKGVAESTMNKLEMVGLGPESIKSTAQMCLDMFS